jgi:hypothetical protein
MERQWLFSFDSLIAKKKLTRLEGGSFQAASLNLKISPIKGFSKPGRG